MRVQPTRQRWEELAATALIGSDRAGKVQPGELLAEAATIGTMRRAGFGALGGAPAVSECGAETAKVCSAGAGTLLGRLMAERDNALLAEWLELAAAAGCVAPPRSVPDLLEVYCSGRSLPSTLPAAVGERGRWLSRLNHAWAGLGESSRIDEGLWHTGTQAQRFAFLRSLRSTEPARAIELLRQSWHTESAEARQHFVGALRGGLSQSDEPFLESCLADRSKSVRQVAAELLADLPGAFARRMVERARAMLQPSPRRSRKALDFEPPARWDESWAGDALEHNPPKSQGKRAWWMRQVLSYLAPRDLEELTGIGPAEFFNAVSSSDYAEDITLGVLDAIAARGDMEWRLAAVNYKLGQPGREPRDMGPLWLPLVPREQEALLRQAIRHESLAPSRKLEMLATCKHRFSAEFSGVVCQVLREAGRGLWSSIERVGPAMESLALTLHPQTVFPLIETLVTDLTQQPAPSVARALDRLRTRAEMHKEFAT